MWEEDGTWYTAVKIDGEDIKVPFNDILTLRKGNEEMSSFLGHLIIEYSNLSSYVHGGMKSYEEMMLADSDEKRDKEYNRICGLSFQMSNSIKLFSLCLVLIKLIIMILI